MTFDKQDFDNQTWRKLEAYLQEQLAKAQRELEKESLTTEQTASIRGGIKRIRLLLALPDKAKNTGPLQD